MKYYVSLGDIELDKVIAVAQNNNRDISVYDSVGGGKFAVPQNKGLREWTIKCEIDDYDVIKDLDKMQKKKTPVRLVINTDGYKVSERVLLKGYTAPEEEYAGVFPVTLTAIEYVKAGIKTADVPYVAREGEPPPLPKAQVLGDGQNGTKTAYDLYMSAQRTAESPYGPVEGGGRMVFDSEEKRNAYLASVQFIDVETGKEVNPAAAEGKTVDLYTYQDRLDPKGELSTGVFGGTATDNVVAKTVTAAWSAISVGLKKFDEGFTAGATGKK